MSDDLMDFLAFALCALSYIGLLAFLFWVSGVFG